MTEQMQYGEKIKKNPCFINLTDYVTREINVLLVGASFEMVHNYRDVIKMGLFFDQKHMKIVIDSVMNFRSFFSGGYYDFASQSRPYRRFLQIPYVDFGFEIPRERREDFGRAVVDFLNEKTALDFALVQDEKHYYMTEISHYYRHRAVVEKLD